MSDDILCVSHNSEQLCLHTEAEDAGTAGCRIQTGIEENPELRIKN